MESFNSTSINKTLGLRLVSTSQGSATIEMDDSPSFSQEKGVIHGGILSTLADTAAVYSFMPGLPEHLLCGSIEFKVNFLAPAIAGNGTLIADGKVIKKGSRVIICESTVRQADKTIAIGLFTYLVWERQEKA